MNRLSTVAISGAVWLFSLTSTAAADECSLSLDKNGQQLIEKATNSEHEYSGRWCGAWEGKYDTNMIFLFREQKVEYVYNVHLPRGRYDYDGKVKYKTSDAGETKFDFGLGGSWKVLVTISSDGELNGVLKDGSKTESTVVMTRSLSANVSATE